MSTNLKTTMLCAAALLAYLSTAASPLKNCMLDNGMKLMLKEGHSSAMVASIITIAAGSRLEPPDINGASHMLEHLLFDGTSARSRGELTEDMRKIGGYFNAFTRKDYTVFICLVPSDEFADGMSIQSEMIFDSILPDAEIEKERKVVMEEINKDNSTDDYRREVIADNVFFAGTSYARPVLGRKNVIASISREEIMRYYRTYYVPANMRAMIVGDIDSAQAKKIMEKYFGGKKQERTAASSGEDPVSRRGGIFKRSVEGDYTYVYINMAAPALGSKDYYPFEILCGIINGSASSWSRALKNDNELGVISSGISYEHHAGFSTATLNIKARSRDAEKITAKALREIRNAAEDACREDVLQGAKVSIVTDEIYNEEKYHYYGMLKADGIALCGGEFLAGKVRAFDRMELGGLRRAAAKYFDDIDYTAIAFVPGGVDTDPPKGLRESKARKILSSRRGVDSAEYRPEPQTAALVPIEIDTIPPAERRESRYMEWTEPCGARIAIKFNTDSRVFAVHVVLENRKACEPEGRQGITEVLSRMLLKGAGTKDESKLDGALKKIGAELTLIDNPYIPYDDYRTKEDYSFIRFQTIDEYYEKGLELLEDIMFNPKLPVENLEQVKDEIRALIAKRDSTPYKAARQLFFGTLFNGHPFSRDVLGDAASLDAITIEDVRNYHKKYFAPDNMIVTVASSIEPAELKKKLGEMFKGRKPGGVGCEPGAVKPISGVVEVRTTVAADQASIYLGNIMKEVPREKIAAASVMSGILSRRLGEELREKRGLAYSVGASLYFGKGYSRLHVSMGTSPDKLDDAKTGLIEIITNLRKGATRKEVESYKSSFRGRMLMRRLTRINQAFYMGLNIHRGFGYAFDEDMIRQMKHVEVEDVNDLAACYLPIRDYVIAVAGPQK